MLVNPKLRHSRLVKEIEMGIFIIGSFNFDNLISNRIEKYYEFEDEGRYLGAYGVCDNIEQVKEKYSKWINDPDLKFFISFAEVKKSDQPSEGGWRWHKWGNYIGIKEPQGEYLYDEDDDIQKVYCYHIYQLIN